MACCRPPLARRWTATSPLKRLVTVFRVTEVSDFLTDPTLDSPGAYAATACHDYPRPYDLALGARSPTSPVRPRDSRRSEPAQFFPFSARAWLRIDI